jgi:hypothetical protein
MESGSQELRIAALLDALDAEHARARAAIGELHQTGEALQRAVKSAAREAVQGERKTLQSDIEGARQVVVDMQRLSLWRAAWQHMLVAIVTIAITVLAVWWYVPSLSEIVQRRAEQASLTASLTNLNELGARIQLSHCVDQKSKKGGCACSSTRRPGDLGT